MPPRISAIISFYLRKQWNLTPKLRLWSSISYKEVDPDVVPQNKSGHAEFGPLGTFKVGDAKDVQLHSSLWILFFGVLFLHWASLKLAEIWWTMAGQCNRSIALSSSSFGSFTSECWLHFCTVSLVNLDISSPIAALQASGIWECDVALFRWWSKSIFVLW